MTSTVEIAAARAPTRKALYVTATALCVGLLACAFVAAPHSCEWGMATYFSAGVAVIVGLVVSPFALARADAIATRFALAAGLGIAGAATWIGGLFAANVRVICRLF
ncbi:MAG: hypothetical protein ABI881_00705 [Betaproteobacteria bacterium]